MATVNTGTSFGYIVEPTGYVTLKTEAGSTGTVQVQLVGNTNSTPTSYSYGPKATNQTFGPYGVQASINVTPSALVADITACDPSSFTGEWRFLSAPLTGTTGGTASNPVPVWIGGSLYTHDGTELNLFSSGVTPALPTLDESAYRNIYYFDPSSNATKSTGAGTEANPFYTVAQVSALLNDTDAYAQALKIKRGTTLTTGINLTIGSSRPDKPFVICPYGDASLPLPMIDVGVVQTGWTLYDSVNNIWTKPLTRSRLLWQVMSADGKTEKRLGLIGNSTLANKLAQLQSVNAGYYFWDSGSSGVMYIKPYNGINPNNGNIIADSGLDASSGGVPLYLNNKSMTKAGNITVWGLQLRHSPASNVAFIVNTSDISTSLGTITVAGCDSRYCGLIINQVSGLNALSGNEVPLSTGGGSSGISVYGKNDTVRPEIFIRNNYIEDCGNNAFETNCVDGGLVEYNTTKDVWGFAWAELYSSTSNLIVRRNSAIYDVCIDKPTYNIGRNGANPEYGCGLFWASGYDAAGIISGTWSQAGIAKSRNNIVEYNISYRCPAKCGGNGNAVIDYSTENLIIRKNIIHCYYPAATGVVNPVQLNYLTGTNGPLLNPTDPVSFTDNIVVTTGNFSSSQYPEPVSVGQHGVSAALLKVKEIERNQYWHVAENSVDESRVRFWNGSTAYGGAGNNGPENLALWVAGTGYDKTSKFSNPLIVDGGTLSAASNAKYLLVDSQDIQPQNIQSLTTAAATVYSVLVDPRSSGVDINGVAPTSITINMPATPRNGDLFTISSSYSTGAILTLTPPAGVTIGGAVTSLAADAYARYRYNAQLFKWVRVG